MAPVTLPRYAAPAVVLAEAAVLLAARVLAPDTVLIVLVAALVTLLIAPTVLVPDPALDDAMLVVLVVFVDSIGNCCSITCT